MAGTFWRQRECADERVLRCADTAWTRTPRRSPPPLPEALEVARRSAWAADALGRHSWTYLSALATLGAVDLTVARVVEPHLDALAVLHQAAAPDLSRIGVGPASTFGVFAAHGPGPAVARLAGSRGWTLVH